MSQKTPRSNRAGGCRLTCHAQGALYCSLGSRLLITHSHPCYSDVLPSGRLLLHIMQPEHIELHRLGYIACLAMERNGTEHSHENFWIQGPRNGSSQFFRACERRSRAFPHTFTIGSLCRTRQADTQPCDTSLIFLQASPKQILYQYFKPSFFSVYVIEMIYLVFHSCTRAKLILHEIISTFWNTPDSADSFSVCCLCRIYALMPNYLKFCNFSCLLICRKPLWS